MFKRSTTNRAQTYIGFEREILAFAAATEFGDVTWYPAQEKVVYRDDVRLPISAPGSGKNDFTGFRLLPSLLMVATRAAGQSKSLIPMYLKLPQTRYCLSGLAGGNGKLSREMATV